MSARPGRIVRIMTFDDAGVPSNAYWWAAIDDDAKAVRAVMLEAGTNADQGVTADGVLSPADVEASGLAPGQVMRADGPRLG